MKTPEESPCRFDCARIAGCWGIVMARGSRVVRVGMLTCGVAVAAGLWGVALAQEAASELEPVGKLQRAYDQAMDLAASPVNGLNDRYVEELGKLKEAVQARGDLEAALMIQREMESFAEEKERDFSGNPELRRLRQIYDENRNQLMEAVREKQGQIGRQASEKLAEIKTELTRAGDLEGAVRADTLRKQIVARLDAGAKRGANPAMSAAEPVRFYEVVEATHYNEKPLETKVKLVKGQRFRIEPNPRDEWSGGGSKRGEFCDFRGYEGSRVKWMALHARIGIEGERFLVDPEEIREAAAEGVLFLFAEDGSAHDNEGRIRVNVIVNPEDEEGPGR